MYGVFLYPSFPGTIGLSLAHQVSKIIGVEVVEKAIEDARWNAAFNGELKLIAAENFKLIAEKWEAEVSGGIVMGYFYAAKGAASCNTSRLARLTLLSSCGCFLLRRNFKLRVSHWKGRGRVTTTPVVLGGCPTPCRCGEPISGWTP